MRRIWLILVILLQGCFLGNGTEVIVNDGGLDASGGGAGGAGGESGGAGGEAGGAGGVGGATDRDMDLSRDMDPEADMFVEDPDAALDDMLVPDAMPPADGCGYDSPLDTVATEGFDFGGGNRWVTEGSTLLVQTRTQDINPTVALLPWTKTCTEFKASVTFELIDGAAFPILLGRYNANNQWFGVGFDAEEGRLRTFGGTNLQPSQTTGQSAAIRLTEGARYRMEMALVDRAIFGALYLEDGDRPLVIARGRGPEHVAPGRIGLNEVNGAPIRFAHLTVAPISRPSLGRPTIESATVFDTHQIRLVTSPEPLLPYRLDEEADGLLIEQDGVPLPVAALDAVDGSRSSLVVTTRQPMEGAGEITVSYVPGAGQILNDVEDEIQPLDDLAAENLLYLDPPGQPAFVEEFEAGALGEGWQTQIPEAISVESGRLTFRPLQQTPTGALAWRPIEELRLNTALVTDFIYNDEPVRSSDRVEVIAALRIREVEQAQVQAVFIKGRFNDVISFRRVLNYRTNAIGTSYEFTTGQLPPLTPLRLEFIAYNQLLIARLYRMDGEVPVLVASHAVEDDNVQGPGSVGLGAAFNGSVQYERLEVRTADAPAPRIISARVPGAAPTTVELDIQTTSALQGLAPAGFSVLAGEPRVVDEVILSDDGVILQLDGARIQGGQTVSVGYDPAAGTLTDSTRPDPLPVEAIEGLIASNEAAAAGDLVIAEALTVDPHTVDMVVADNGALPITVGAAEGLMLIRDEGPLTIRQVRPLAEANDRVRISVIETLDPGDVITLQYTPGEVGPILDSGGGELRAVDGAPVANLIEPPVDFDVVSDGFNRANGALGEPWSAGTPGLWSIVDNQARFTAPGTGDPNVDTRLLWPGTYDDYRASVHVYTPANVAFSNNHQVALIGNVSVPNPAQPTVLWDVRTNYNLRTGRITIQYERLRSEVISPADSPVILTPGDDFELEMEVSGPVIIGRLIVDGAVALEIADMISYDPPPGPVGVYSGLETTVRFDDFRVEPLGAAPAQMLVSGARVVFFEPDTVQVDVETLTGALYTGGGPEGWRINIDGASREVLGVTADGDTLKVRFAGPAVARRNQLTISYDATVGDVHDGADDLYRPLPSFGPLVVDNQAEIGADLFIEKAEVVAPWAVDLVFNDQAALPPIFEASAHTAMQVVSGGRPLTVRKIISMARQDGLIEDRLRLLMASGSTFQPGEAITITYQPGLAGARVSDRDNREMAAPYTVTAVNTLEPDEALNNFLDDFLRPGTAIANGWIVDPAEVWSLENAAQYDGVGFNTRATLLRPANEIHRNTRQTMRVRLQPGAGLTLTAGLVSRVGNESGSYQGVYTLNDDNQTVLRVERLERFGAVALAEVPVSPLVDNREYSFEFISNGPVFTLILRDGQDILGRAVGVDTDAEPDDPEADKPTGQHGVVIVGRGRARISEYFLQRVTGFSPRIQLAQAEVLEYDPDVIRITLAAAADLLPIQSLNPPLNGAGSQGFSVTVNGEARGVTDITFDPDGDPLSFSLQLEDGTVIDEGDNVRLSFDPYVGAVLDNSEIPQMLGAISSSRASFVAKVVPTSVDIIGPNLITLTLQYTDAAQVPITVQGRGGLSVWATDPDNPEEIEYSIYDVWVDPAQDPQPEDEESEVRLYIATRNPIPTGGFVRIGVGSNGSVLDAQQQAIAPLSEPQFANRLQDLHRQFNYFDGNALYSHTWTLAPIDRDVGWRYSHPDQWALINEDAPPPGVASYGSGLQEEATSAFAPPTVLGRDMTVIVEFEIQPDVEPFSREGFPRVNVKGLNNEAWVGCYIRNGERPAFTDATEETFEAGPLTPSLNCVYEEPSQGRRYFEECRFQFYETPNIRAYGGAESADWLDASPERHRLKVSMLGQRLRATLYNVDANGSFPGAGPNNPIPVAVVEVPDVGTTLEWGMPGIGSYDSGTVEFINFRARPTRQCDFNAQPGEATFFAPTEGAQACPRLDPITVDEFGNACPVDRGD